MNQSENINELPPVLNLYQKLVEVRKRCSFMKKEADGYKFKYVEEGALLSSIREEMDNQRVFLECDMVSLDPIEVSVIIDRTLRTVPGLRGIFEFKWTDCDNPSDVIIKKFILQDSEQDAQACGGMLTYANRYFLLKFFSVPTGKDDPDARGEKVILEKSGVEEGSKGSKASTFPNAAGFKITQKQAGAIQGWARSYPLEMEDMLKDLGVDAIEDILFKDCQRVFDNFKKLDSKNVRSA